MAKVFNSDEVIFTNHNGICPDCVDHVRGEPTDYIDCKNVFRKKIDGEWVSVGQCCCWSEVHGKRR